MSKAEAFRKHYPLTNSQEGLLELGLTGHEIPLRLTRAMTERLKEQAELAEMNFLAAAQIGEAIIRIYFFTGDGLFFKDLERVSRDPNYDIFHDILAYNASQGDYANRDYITLVPHRPN